MKSWFKDRENDQEGTCYSLEDVLDNLTFDSDGLIPVIAQDQESKEILMFAWMNETALRETIDTGRMCYWSRSRKSLWRKGETSGHWQSLKDLRTDCDGDVLLAEISQEGGACHTMRRSCFFWKLDGGQFKLSSES